MDKSAPRYQAGSMKLPDGAGEITTMFSCCGFLEIFTEKSSYKVLSPESIDPEETNPNTPWVTSKAYDYGSSNRVVARVLLQSEEMFKTAVLKDKDDVKQSAMQLIYECKDALLICEKISSRINKATVDIIEKIESEGLSIESGGRHINSFPQVENLEEDVTNYLINIKRAIGKICYLASIFLPLTKKDNNIEYLIKNIEKLNDKKHNKLLESLGNFKAGVKHLIDLRNNQEHPDDIRTHIENFKMTPDNKICHPVWYVTGNEAESIIAAMEAAISFVISLCETMLVHLLFICLDTRFPFIIEEIPDDKIDKKTPIKYRLSINVGQFNL